MYFAVLLCVLLNALNSRADERPNIIFILADDVGWRYYVIVSIVLFLSSSTVILATTITSHRSQHPLSMS